MSVDLAKEGYYDVLAQQRRPGITAQPIVQRQSTITPQNLSDYVQPSCEACSLIIPSTRSVLIQRLWLYVTVGSLKLHPSRHQIQWICQCVGRCTPYSTRYGLYDGWKGRRHGKREKEIFVQMTSSLSVSIMADIYYYKTRQRECILKCVRNPCEDSFLGCYVYQSKVANLQPNNSSTNWLQLHIV